jgi:hypothetical protein
MYAIVARFPFRAAPDAALLQRIEQEIIEPISKQPGFRAYYGIRTSDTDAIAVHVWESQADAERALQLILPRLQALAGEGLVGTPERSMGEVVTQR